MGDKKVRAVGYARVSTKNQLIGREFTSIDAQKTIIVYYAQTHSEIELVQIFSDPGRSGKNMKRPGMQVMIERIKQGDTRATSVGRKPNFSKGFTRQSSDERIGRKPARRWLRNRKSCDRKLWHAIRTF